MAAKRRRSRSKSGGSIGCAPFLALIVIAHFARGRSIGINWEDPSAP